MIEVPQVITIASIDSSGGAGINADLKTFHNQKVYAATIVVGLTAQNTYGVQDQYAIPTTFISEQFKSIADDLDIKAAKTGALLDAQRVHTVAKEWQIYQLGKLIIDPVMVAKGGAHLLSDDAITTMINELIPQAFLITPNLPEAEVLVNHQIVTDDDVKKAATKIQSMGVKNVLIKGGHRADSENNYADYMLYEDGSFEWLVMPGIETNRTHGTGDTLSAFITANLAKGYALKAIMPHAKKFTYEAIRQTINVGHGHGPLNHWVETTMEND
ncbi:bifunctional hydroxymethylpyrimidine kinase/phosphomethylpyrimidine kinase [Weissella bombi]|uniref:Hydroxymethylpyrimidine/phosphomethylpyrimidine kinase n=1 Tax=Weissella bombi TaxID=1505725 RepID=A0A1C3YXQ3_9LACO|nr:bifunctional hydroxymethylpyrimidine kinase/phosphomethylpyrimidine kinase [Weissella bombi]SCB74798.1 hydroxymethylpyrimidine/phosphomethylpyrimidine kinase [Weissella bombi]